MTRNNVSHALKILIITIVIYSAIAKIHEAFPQQLATIRPQILWIRRRWKPTYKDVIDDIDVCIKKCSETCKNDQSLLIRCITKCSAIKMCTGKCEEQFSGNENLLQKCYKRCNKSN
ncbi:hypothetical protein AAHE18_02G193600 [Arachis hypogaea]